MRATVTYPYRDRETLEVHRTGDEVELTAERLAELSAAGYVDAPEQAAEPEPAPEKASQPEEPAEPGSDEPAQAEHEPPREMTAAQLRAEIEARGGFAPKKATKAQLAELLEQL